MADSSRNQSPELVAMMLADGRLPTGGHTQSSGLEPAVKAGLADNGRRLQDVAQYVRDRQRTVIRTEAGTAVVARHLTLQGDDPRGAEPYWAARTPSHVVRATSRRQGRAYLRLAERVWPKVLQYLPRDGEVPRAVVLGVIGAVTDLSAVQVARIVGYDDAQTVTAASLKLLPVDPIHAATWLHEAGHEIECMVDAVGHLTDPRQIPADGAPLVDAYAQRHSTEKARLFHA
jgi:urease accessory protein